MLTGLTLCYNVSLCSPLPTSSPCPFIHLSLKFSLQIYHLPISDEHLDNLYLKSAACILDRKGMCA